LKVNNLEIITTKTQMKTRFSTAFCAMFFCVSAALAVNEPAIIPLPQNLTRLDGAFKLTPNTRLYTDPASMDTGGFLAEQLRKSTGGRFRISGKTTPDLETKIADGILLTTKDADAALGQEGYELVVSTNSVVIRAPSQAGLFYGVQTLLQLLPPEIFSAKTVKDFDWQIPCVKITDSPRFGWRGLMLDVSRHFFTKDEVKQLLDAMALHKLNTFHWHLVDDNGWRIEIKKYPKLTAVGAWRGGLGFGLPTNSTTAYGPDGRYGGFYTQDDIREVVAYAEKLHITIVPEIEMPGHSLAALSAYPEFGTGDGPFVVPLKGGVNPGIYSPAKAGTFQFLDDVLTEVAQLFPSKYIHIGGDEVPKGPWKNDAACQALMKEEGLKNEEELQSWFIRRVEKIVNAKGKTILGWSEILQGGLAQNAAVMDWIGGGREAASQGHDVVMTPTSYCYFDYYQGQDHSVEPRAIGGYLPLQKVYSFEPVPAKLAPEMQKHILGGQGNVWTEYIPNFKQVEYMAFPRLSALAEVTWSPKESRNFDDFIRRLKTDNQRLDQLGVSYRLYRPDTRTQIGGWKPAQIKNEMSPLEWDVTKNVTAAGNCRVTLEYTAGACGIDIAWVALLEDDKEISRDTHDGFTGSSPRKPVYSLDVPAPKPGARYTLRAQVAGSGGTDSTGNLFWDLKPAAK
jgi:hexosaminidase